MAGEGGRTWRTWQLLVVAAIALTVGIGAGVNTKTKTTTVSAGSSPAVTNTEAPTVATTSPPTTVRVTTTPAPTSPPTTAGPKTTFSGEGQYIVGKDIAAGTYRTAGPKTGSSLCYWERESDLTGGFGSIITNDTPKGAAVVTIAASDKGFKTSGCQEWSPA